MSPARGVKSIPTCFPPHQAAAGRLLLSLSARSHPRAANVERHPSWAELGAAEDINELAVLIDFHCSDSVTPCKQQAHRRKRKISINVAHHSNPVQARITEQANQSVQASKLLLLTDTRNPYKSRWR
uniref:Uncharacterized protein n=1 Tax=Arundo donax TaxID=35708 RepID=A0A0A9DU77_ARUDO